MKNKKLIIVLLLISLFTFSGCFESNENTSNTENKNEEKDNTKNEEKKEEKQEISTISDVKNYSYVRTLDAYVNVIKTVTMTGKYSMYNTKTLYLFPVGKNDFVTENKDTSPYSNEWKYIFVGVTYDSSVYNYYVLALDGSNIGTDFTSYKTLEIESIENINEASAYKELYNLTSNKTYSLSEMNEALKELANAAGSNEISVFVK